MNDLSNFKNTWTDQLLNSPHIGILVVDDVRNNLFVNEKICELFGYTKEEIEKDTARIFHCTDESFMQFGKQAFESVLRGVPVQLDYQFRRKDGSCFWGHISGDLMQNQEEVLWTLVDMSTRKTLEVQNFKKAQIIEQLQDGIITIDLEGNFTSWNQGAQRILGYSKEDVLGKSTEMVYLKEDIEKRKKNLQLLIEKGVFYSERKLRKKDGSIITTGLTGSLLKSFDGKPIGMIGYFKDISIRLKAQKELEETNYNLQQYMDVIDKIDIGIFIVNEDFSVRYMNNTMISWFGNQTNKTCYSAVAGLDSPCPYCKLSDVIFENKKVIYEPTTPDGQSFDIVATSIKNLDGSISKMEVIRNVTDSKQVQRHIEKQQELLQYQAHHDALTGLANRVLFSDRLKQAMKKSKRNKTVLALLFIDLDHFKEINDSLGHNIGDEVLKEVSKRLHSVIRDEDSLSRLGGDEFTVIVEGLEHEQSASTSARKILDALSQPFNLGGHMMYVSCSIGISLFPRDGESIEDIIKFADSAMYKAKKEGRNNFQFYNTEMTRRSLERILMEADLRKAIENDEFVVYYQPQVDGSDNTIKGMEGLVRWQHPTRGFLAPADFIPLAESTGLIKQIDQIVMQKAMTQFKKWYSQGYEPGVLSLNLTVQQLRDKDFIKTLQTRIEHNKCNRTNLELEVTESEIMQNPKQAIKVLQEIYDLGINLAIDDFGTGYSSLSYLKRLPITKLKIDQSFVQNLPSDEEDKAIAIAVIALSKSLKLDVIAEGIETKEQRDFLVNNGCHLIQGYFYSKPLCADKITLILKNGF